MTALSFRERVFSQITQAEQRLENASLILDGEYSVDAVPLLYKSADILIRTLIGLKQNPSPDYQKNLNTLKQMYPKEKFLDKEAVQFLESLAGMNNHYQKKIDPGYTEASIKEAFDKTEKFLKAVRKFLKNQLMTEEEQRAEKRMRKFVMGSGAVLGAAVIVFFIFQFVQSLLAPQNGLLAYYYNNINLTGSPIAEIIDKKINFNWGKKSPHPQITQNFSVRWEGQIQIEKSSDYTFFIQSDEGVKFDIDGNVLINTWSMEKRPVESSAEIHLEKGLHQIKLEYFFNQYHADLKLLWSSPSFSRKIVKSKVLFPPGELEE